MRLLLLSAVVSTFLFTSCLHNDKEVNVKLDDAEQTLKDDPNKAYRQLDAIDVSKLNDSSTIARWISLYGEALMNNGMVSIDGNDALQARYIQKLVECSDIRERHEKQTSIVISILMTFILFMFVSYQNRRARYHKAMNEVLLTKASSLQSAVKCNKLLLSRKQEAINDGFAERMAAIDKLCNDYYETANTATEKYEIVRKLYNVMNSMKCSTDIFRLFEGVVNERRPQLLALLKKEMPNISTDDYRLYVYLACGVSIQTISLLTGNSVAAIYHNRNKLRQQISRLKYDAKMILQEMV